MVVVSNAGPLIALSRLGQLALLPALYGRVLIPQLETASKGLLTIPEFELLIEEIKRRPEFWISEQLCDAALEQVRTGQRPITGEE